MRLFDFGAFALSRLPWDLRMKHTKPIEKPFRLELDPSGKFLHRISSTATPPHPARKAAEFYLPEQPVVRLSSRLM